MQIASFFFRLPFTSKICWHMWLFFTRISRVSPYSGWCISGIYHFLYYFFKNCYFTNSAFLLTFIFFCILLSFLRNSYQRWKTFYQSIFQLKTLLVSSLLPVGKIAE